ncbi:Gfo/Idh/MocA family oxidoreductase [Halorubrum saccharovorum]|uniref:Gfo/Idh/MocA family protein n=1 Tax=Halorubrum saccharovorum TaxID=2248 RepID=UPI0026B33E8D|nr:Gfo/Idh/MocA family oxidoreductase [Halorubrum saccharovorum]
MEPLSVGVLGCGTISDAYFSSDDQFDCFEITACADLDSERSAAKADEYRITSYDTESLLESDVEAVVNLTPPSVHAQTCEQLLDAGKHVYVEKPLAATVKDAKEIVSMADESDLLVGSAPDTFLGAGLQTCRSIIDSGRIGEPIGATAIWTSSGHESWHPNPDFYYAEGGGPLFDMGPYYVTALVSLLGSASRVTGSVKQTFSKRTITSEPRNGEEFDVEVPTHETGIIEFENGTIANLLMSFDVNGGSSLPELHSRSTAPKGRSNYLIRTISRALSVFETVIATTSKQSNSLTSIPRVVAQVSQTSRTRSTVTGSSERALTSHTTS